MPGSPRPRASARESGAESRVRPSPNPLFSGASQTFLLRKRSEKRAEGAGARALRGTPRGSRVRGPDRVRRALATASLSLRLCRSLEAAPSNASRARAGGTGAPARALQAARSLVRSGRESTYRCPRPEGGTHPREVPLWSCRRRAPSATWMRSWPWLCWSRPGQTDRGFVGHRTSLRISITRSVGDSTKRSCVPRRGRICYTLA